MQKIQSIHNCENCKLKYKNVNFGNQSFVQTITNVSWWPFNDAVKNANYANNMIHIPIASFVIMKASCLERVSTEERVSKADHGKTIERDGKILLNGLICRSMMLQLQLPKTPAEHTGWSKISGTPDLFFDNFGKSTPILTILSPLQQEIHGA